MSEQEWEIMKSHSMIGVKLLSPLRTMQLVIEIVGHHHEHWNGDGYPCGFQGNEIPYLARVFQILDAYDALTHERPYKMAIDHEKALNIIRDEAINGKWDPLLVESYESWKRRGSESHEIEDPDC